MNIEDMKNRLGIVNPRHLSIEQKNYIVDSTNFLGEGASLPERIYCLINNIKSRPVCSCGTELQFITQNKGYKKLCRSCSRDRNIIEKYGSRQAYESSRVSKMKSTNIDRHGVDVIFKREDVKRNIEKANQKPKKKQSLDSIIIPYIKEQMEVLVHNNSIKGVMKMTGLGFVKLHRYLRENNINITRNRLKTKESLHILEDKDVLYELYQKNTQQQIADNLDVAQSTVGLYLRHHDIDTTRWFAHSSYEVEILDFIKSIYSGKVITNDRTLLKPKEVDIFIPDKNVAIEFNGLFWHSSVDNTLKNLHLDKTNIAESHKVHLLHIFSNEWDNKKDIWKSVISNKLHCTSNRVFSRKCSVHPVPCKEAKAFFDNNHLQGGNVSGKTIGLYYDHELVSAIMFGSSRFDVGCTEIYRFANKINTSVVGSFSKLISRVPKDTPIVSYANRRWSQGNVYERCGFTLEKITPPNYFFLNQACTDVVSRHNFQKHKLVNLPNYDCNKTADELLKESGVRRIYDCGNLKYIL